MKTCGTVLRPLRRSISRRCSGCASISISWILTPLAVSNARALSQYGHQLLQYMTTGEALMRHSTARQRQILGAPGRKAAAQVKHLGETLLHQGAHGRRGRRATIAIDDQRALFVFPE